MTVGDSTALFIVAEMFGSDIAPDVAGAACHRVLVVNLSSRPTTFSLAWFPELPRDVRGISLYVFSVCHKGT